MKIYHLKQIQCLPISLPEAWRFFSAPQNLANITPANMGFHILYISGNRTLYAGQLIRYKIRIFPFLSFQWLTEITHVHEPYFFVDEQRAGPYAFWHHQHHFREVPNGVEVTDEVTYAIPFGIIGKLAHLLFVRRRLNIIFDYRRATLEKHFKNETQFQSS